MSDRKKCPPHDYQRHVVYRTTIGAYLLNPARTEEHAIVVCSKCGHEIGGAKT